MVVSMLPTSVFAADATCPGKGAAHTVENCTYEAKGTVAPTCKDAGYTVYQCSKCGDTFVGNFNYELAEHTYVPAKDQAPTCSEPGYKGGLKCSVCGDLTGAEEVPALGEGVSCLFGDWDVTVFDCTKNFTATRFCVNCNAKDEVKYEVAKDYKGHVMGDWVKGENGVITRTCTCTFSAKEFTWKCVYTETSTALAVHNHDASTLLFVAEVAAKCEVSGTAAHYECRECGELFVLNDKMEFVATTAEKLVIASLHDQMKDELNCKTTTAICDECGNVINVGAAAHKYGAWDIKVAANCLTDGFRTRTCTVCELDTQTEIIPALGHATCEYTVDATCVQYKYTFTYCVRPGCGTVLESKAMTVAQGQPAVSFDLTVGSAKLPAAIAGVGFYLTVNQGNLDKTLYFDGMTEKEAGVNNGKEYYLHATTKMEEAVKVYLEVVTNDGVNQTYNMYFLKGEEQVKTYISIYKSGNYINAKIGTSVPTTTWAWNAEAGILTTTIEETEYYLGMYNEYSTFSASKLSYLATSFGSEMVVTNENGVQLLNLVADVKAGFDSEAHTLENLVYTAPTCVIEGTRIQYCIDCMEVMPTEVLPIVDHKWVVDSSKTEVKPSCTTSGKKYFVCEYCSKTKVETVDALGHTLETEKKNGQDVVKVYTHAGHHKDLLAYQYNLCTVCNNEVIIPGTQKTWDGATKIFNTFADAVVAHNGSALTENKALSVKGNCFTTGYTAYSCADCDNVVRVKEAGSGEHEPAPKSNAPDCLNAGGYITYICSKCETKVGEGIVGETFNKTADALGHKMKKNNKYVKSTCENPNLDETTNYAEYCERCNHKVHDYKYTGNDKVLGEGDNLCTSVTYREIECKEHGVHTINHIGGYGHSYIQDSAKKNVKPTCTSEGTNYFVCEYCGTPKAEPVAKTNHKDADGEFSELCLAKDRHCELCCACKKLKDHDCTNPDGDKKTDDACSCVKKADQHDYKTQYTGSTCEQYPTKATICTLCHKSKDVVQYTEYNKAPIVLGHKPAAAPLKADGSIDKKLGFEYKYITYVSYVWEMDAETEEYVLVENAESYWAVYAEYTEATLTEGGNIVYNCATCKKTITEGTETINALQFSAEIRGEDFTFGSLVAVDLYVNGVNKELYGFTFSVDFAGMRFVGAEKTGLGNTFICQTSKPAEVTSAVNVAGYVAGSTKNVTVNEKTLLTTLYFRVVDSKISAGVDHIKADETVSKYLGVVEGKAKYEYFTATMAKASEVEVANYMDLDGNGDFNFNDVLVGVQILNMELEYDYDVAGDVDYDGVFTITDLTNMVAVYLANNQEVAMYGVVIDAIGTEHAELMGLVEVCPTCKTVYAYFEKHECPKA